MKIHRRFAGLATLLAAALAWSNGGLTNAHEGDAAGARLPRRPRSHADTILYIWAGDQERVRPDFLAVIDFDEESADYGRVVRTVPLPPPGNVGNEPHHCHLSVDEN